MDSRAPPPPAASGSFFANPANDNGEALDRDIEIQSAPNPASAPQTDTLPLPALPLSSSMPASSNQSPRAVNEHESRSSSRNLIRRLSGPFRRQGPLRPFRLLRQDLRHFAQRYPSDWTVFNQLVLASAVYVFFTNLLPGITFASDLYELTGRNWGSVEIVLSTGLCGVIFSVFSAQPLTILGITGPFSILAESIYALCRDSFKIPFLPFMAWSLIHTAWMHYLLAIFNAHDWTMRYVTNFSAEIFSLLNSLIYFNKAIQELRRIHDTNSFASFLYAIIGALGTCFVAMFLATAHSWKPLFHRYVRMLLSEYAAAISIVIFIGVPYIGELADLDKRRLQVSRSFRPTSPERTGFFVRFWQLPVAWVFAAIIPALVITILFFFDHEISSIICTMKRYNTRKPGGFAWDIVLLGTTTALCGILGIPPANGLLPQAPLHSESLMHTVVRSKKMTESSPDSSPKDIAASPEHVKPTQEIYEQRWSHFLHAAGILVFVSPPFMHVLGLIPTSVLAGLFLFMGEQSLGVKCVYLVFAVACIVNLVETDGNSPILFRFALLLTAPAERAPLPDSLPSYWSIHTYTIVQILVTVGVFVITFTKAAPVFPIIFIILVPVRLLLMKRLWNRETLRYVDGWACKEGTPEDDEDAGLLAARQLEEQGREKEPSAAATFSARQDMA